MNTAKPAVQKWRCNLIWSSKSPEFGLPVGFPGSVLFVHRFKNSVKPGKLLLANSPQVPPHLPTNPHFDYSLSPAKTGRKLVRFQSPDSLSIQELLAPVFIGLRSLLMGENGLFLAFKAPRGQFALLQGFKKLFLACFYLSFWPLAQEMRAL